MDEGWCSCVFPQPDVLVPAECPSEGSHFFFYPPPHPAFFRQSSCASPASLTNVQTTVQPLLPEQVVWTLGRRAGRLKGSAVEDSLLMRSESESDISPHTLLIVLTVIAARLRGLAYLRSLTAAKGRSGMIEWAGMEGMEEEVVEEEEERERLDGGDRRWLADSVTFLPVSRCEKQHSSPSSTGETQTHRKCLINVKYQI